MSASRHRGRGADAGSQDASRNPLLLLPPSLVRQSVRVNVRQEGDKEDTGNTQRERAGASALAARKRFLLERRGRRQAATERRRRRRQGKQACSQKPQLQLQSFGYRTTCASLRPFAASPSLSSALACWLQRLSSSPSVCSGGRSGSPSFHEALVSFPLSLQRCTKGTHVFS